MDPILNNTLPVFIKDTDWGKRMTEFNVCSIIAEATDPDHLFGCQRIRSLWRIYIKTKDAQTKLLTEPLVVEGRTIPVYRDNPYRTGADSPEDNSIRITIKDLPLSVHQNALEHYLTKEGITTARKVEYARARDPQTRQLSSWYNGDRIVYAKVMKQALPRFVQISTYTCRVFHDGQEERQKLCTNCYSKEHTRGACKNSAACKCCKKPGHTPGDKQCEGYLAKGHQKITTVHSAEDPLSNFFPCEVDVLGMTFNSSEQGYQYSKAIRRGQPDIATQITQAPTAQMAKAQAKFLKTDKNWTKKEKSALMKQLLEAKAEQVPSFKEALLASGKNTIVEAVNNQFEWGSGLTSEETLHTKKKFWPGENLLGSLLEELRTKLENPPTNSPGRKHSTR